MTEFATIIGNPYMGCEVVMPKPKKHKDMKKECRINEINEQIKKLKCEKKKLKCDGSVKIPEFSVKDDNGCVILEDRRGGDHCGRAVWLSERYNWEIVKDGDNWGRTLIPTEK